MFFRISSHSDKLRFMFPALNSTMRKHNRGVQWHYRAAGGDAGGTAARRRHRTAVWLIGRALRGAIADMPLTAMDFGASSLTGPIPPKFTVSAKPNICLGI